MSQNNERPETRNYSSISLYARPPDSLNAMFALIDENNQNWNNSPNATNLMTLLAGMNTDGTETTTNPEPSNWSVHSPETRTIFNELKMKLKDIESIYKQNDENINHSVISTIETIQNTKKLEESVEYFKDKINKYFGKFVECQLQCEKEEAFLSQCSSLLDVIQTPSLEEHDFNECASSICNSLETFILKITQNISENRKNRDIYWSHYKEFRDACKLIKVVQSDLICQICMAEEVNMALNCGHAFCKHCATRCNVCPNCRTTVSQTLKLFF